jgi:hypothetical protein
MERDRPRMSLNKSRIKAEKIGTNHEETKHTKKESVFAFCPDS